MKRFAGTACLAVAIGLVAGAANAAFPGRNGRIVFVRNGLELVTVSPTGGGERVIVSGMSVSAPRWSPDGKRIVFSGSTGDDQPPSSRVFVVNADGSGLRALTKPPEGALDLDPGWSPDGKQILFGRRYASPIVRAAAAPPRAAINSLYVIRPDGDGLRLLERNGRTPAWSPDGKAIVFVVDGDRGPATLHWLAMIKSDGTGRQALISPRSYEEDSPTWSPDSRRIVFVDAGRIVSVARDGTDSRVLTDGTLPDASPAYSPDGRQIVFVRNFATRGAPPYRLVVMTKDGYDPRQFLTIGANTFSPDWQPLSRHRLAG